jgi:transposase
LYSSNRIQTIYGRLSLYAALEVKSGRVTGKTAARHTSCDFIGFLREVISSCPSGQEIHIILDNLSAHKTHAVREFLEQNPASPLSLHAHLLLLAQPSRDPVRQDRT